MHCSSSRCHFGEYLLILGCTLCQKVLKIQEKKDGSAAEQSISHLQGKSLLRNYCKTRRLLRIPILELRPFPFFLFSICFALPFSFFICVLLFCLSFGFCLFVCFFNLLFFVFSFLSLRFLFYLRFFFCLRFLFLFTSYYFFFFVFPFFSLRFLFCLCLSLLGHRTKQLTVIRKG